ncbi:intraflagellar transport protein 57 [Culex quinquefasciatus]|uniref:Intraflagellar transport protein 57 n=3 Tax=Culex pipiens complex TaxID=518105 RepID=B0XJ67_CULQU|nr:intraflagellar transport protein 57 homolog [Culex quinquefasciatus]EDS30030.1 intraflagellar transport protein 57 [Culex quinquefasciatus]|eukprot:XP_001869689.1 intraflagellar transport protein 57 [Culex quinquefasciatus]
MFRHEYGLAMDRDQNGASSVSSYQVDDLMEKLKLLNYERLLLKEMKMKQINRYYFLKSFNPGEQFFMFTSICAWLIRKIGKTFDQPQEFDDPNMVISRIIRVLQEMDVPTDFQTNKLIQGAGPICVYIMDCLATQALKLTKFQLKRPECKKEDDPMVDLIENDSEIILEKVEEEQMAGASDESDDEGNGLFDLNFADQKSKKVTNKEYKVDSLTDSENWRLELERVLPQLKVVVKTDSRDWRAHLEQMRSLRSNIESATEETDGQLKKLQTDISYVMEKIESREKHLNNDLKELIQQYKQILVEYNQVNGLMKENDQEKTEKEHELSKITNELENIKIQMEQRGNSMTDGSPLINIKKAIFRIKEEISEMDIKIGVMEHTLNSEIIKQSTQYAEFDSLVMAH